MKIEFIESNKFDINYRNLIQLFHIFINLISFDTFDITSIYRSNSFLQAY